MILIYTLAIIGLSHVVTLCHTFIKSKQYNKPEEVTYDQFIKICEDDYNRCMKEHPHRGGAGGSGRIFKIIDRRVGNEI